MLVRHLFALLGLLFLLTSCSRHSSPYPQQEQLQMLEYQDYDMEFPEAAPAPGSYGQKSSGISTRGYGSGGGGKAPAKKEVVQAQEQRPQSVHYNGYASLRVSRTDEAADTVSQIAMDVGGHVEELNPSRVSIRVPVDQFREVFAQILELGDVLNKSISATDISESLTSVELRLSTANATRERLVRLLAKAEDENEKLNLILQIQRLTEEIDRLSGQSQTLHSLATMSRITIHLVAREALTGQYSGADIAELAWIRQLSPFHWTVSEGHDRLELDIPEGFVELDPKGQFKVESADGARLWTGRLVNQPRGDTDFWLEAIRERLSNEFGEAEVIEKGSFKLLRLVDREEDPYTYIIGVRANGRHLDLIEIYYPSSAQEERHGGSIFDVIAGGAS